MKTTASKRIVCAALCLAAVLLPGCDRAAKNGFLGSAVVEIRTWQVSSAVAGQIAAVYKEEGDRVEAGELLAVIDTVPLTLKGRELAALYVELNQQLAAKASELSAGATDVEGLKREVDRISGLADRGSVPSQQRDNLKTQHESASRKMKAAELALAGFAARRKVLDAQQAQLDDQVRRCYIRSAQAGSILTRYRSAGELAGPAFPLYELGAGDTVEIDFFVPQPALSGLVAGGTVRIRLDAQPDRTDTEKEKNVNATITWISDNAEFSPKNIQTRETRNELVFKVRARAANGDGLLKRGLPVEVWK